MTPATATAASNSNLPKRTAMRIAIIPAAAACTAALIATASPARADDQSFLNYLANYLAAHGQSTTAWPMSPAQFVILGHGICTNLHAGADPVSGHQSHRARHMGSDSCRSRPARTVPGHVALMAGSIQSV
jgi:hypothetical protein